MTERSRLPAGRFSTWLDEFDTAQEADAGAAVPCGTCTGCCTSSQFIHVGPDETATMARIPGRLLFPAPGLPNGNMLMGYDEHGHCPMFVAQRCSIYEDRPRTCRRYDCRVLPAAGLTLNEPAKAAISHQIDRWEFDQATPRDETLLAAVRAAASFLMGNEGQLPDGAVPRQPTQVAFLAVRIHRFFLDVSGESGDPRLVEPTVEAVAAELQRLR